MQHCVKPEINVLRKEALIYCCTKPFKYIMPTQNSSRSAMDSFDECMHELDQCDNADLVDNLDGYINIYKNTFCDGRTIRKRFQRCKIS